MKLSDNKTQRPYVYAKSSQVERLPDYFLDMQIARQQKQVN